MTLNVIITAAVSRSIKKQSQILLNLIYLLTPDQLMKSLSVHYNCIRKAFMCISYIYIYFLALVSSTCSTGVLELQKVWMVVWLLCVSPVFWLTTCPRCSLHLSRCQLGSGSRPFPHETREKVRRDDNRIDYWSGFYNLFEYKVAWKKTISLCPWTLSLCPGYSIDS